MNHLPETTSSPSNLFDLAGRVAVVAGGAGYLGNGVCRELRRHGARVVVADLDPDRAQRLAEELHADGPGPQCSAIPLDIRQDDSIRQLVDRVEADYRRLDILVNATCAPHERPWPGLAREEFNRSLDANISGSFLLARQAKCAMRDGGNMVIFSSMYGRVAPDPRVYVKPMEPNALEYGVSKAGLEQMIRYLAVAWASDRVRINGIALGPFPNPQVQASHPDFVERLAQKVPLGRIGRADEAIGPVLFLVSEAASYVTGQTLAVDGGWTAW